MSDLRRRTSRSAKIQMPCKTRMEALGEAPPEKWPIRNPRPSEAVTVVGSRELKRQKLKFDSFSVEANLNQCQIEIEITCVPHGTWKANTMPSSLFCFAARLLAAQLAAPRRLAAAKRFMIRCLKHSDSNRVLVWLYRGAIMAGRANEGEQSGMKKEYL